ncbi:hypothetical protein GGR52DRAFT_538987 [Hypoxylon sp. FL1284]|nr:hypothetical protein GGR52DRAFT_538987 [Hypoxylon sp. FL1284]
MCTLRFSLAALMLYQLAPRRCLRYRLCIPPSYWPVSPLEYDCVLRLNHLSVFTGRQLGLTDCLAAWQPGWPQKSHMGVATNSTVHWTETVEWDDPNVQASPHAHAPKIPVLSGLFKTVNETHLVCAIAHRRIIASNGRYRSQSSYEPVVGSARALQRTRENSRGGGTVRWANLY